MLRLIAALLGFVAPALLAQGVEVSAGASTLVGVEGVTVTHYLGDRTSVLSVGRNGNGFAMGGATEFERPDGVTRYGDTAFAFALPTDIDAAGRAVGARGVDWTRVGEGSSVRVFAGKTGDSMGMGYLRTVDPERWGASVVWTQAVSPACKLSALGAAGAAHAALASAEWVRGTTVDLAATAGWNAGHGIFVASAKLSGETWKLRASETVGLLELRPETAAPHALDEAHIPERQGLNFSVQKRFGSWLESDGERVQYGKDLAGGLPDGAVLHEAGVTAHGGEGLGLGVRVLASEDGPNRTRGVAGLSQWTRGAWRLEATLLESWRAGPGVLSQGRSGSLMATLTRDVAGRVRVTGGADFSGSTPDFVAGAEVRGSWGSVGVSERMVYVPFGLQAGFTKVTEVSLRVHPKGVETSFDTLVGRGVPWTYTAMGDRFVETAAGGAGVAGARQASVDMLKYVVRGRVVDEAGVPVAAAAVRVNGSTTVWTDSDGQWEARERRAGAVHLQLATAEFVTARRYEAVDEAGGMGWAGMDAAAAPPVVLRVRACGACVAEVAGPAGKAERVPAAAVRPKDGAKDLVETSVGGLKWLERLVWRGDLR